MKCLNEYQLEMINDGCGKEEWIEHMNSCLSCSSRMKELKANLEIQQDIVNTLRVSREK